MQGDFAAASTFHEQSLELHRRLGDATAVAYATNNLANAALQQWRPRPGPQALRASRRPRPRIAAIEQGQAFGSINMADVPPAAGGVRGRANDFTRGACRRSVSSAIRWGEAYRPRRVRSRRAPPGDVETARVLHVEAPGHRPEMGDRRGVARALANLATWPLTDGDFRGTRLVRECLATAHGDAATCRASPPRLERLAGAWSTTIPRLPRASIGAAEALREATGRWSRRRRRSRTSRTWPMLEARLGGEAFEAGRAERPAVEPSGALATLPL